MDLATVIDSTPDVRAQLLDRRRRLERVIAGSTDARPLSQLLTDVDAALARLDSGSFGGCEVCHGVVEADRLAADPLTRTCLECLTAAQQRALERDLDLASRVQRLLLPPADMRTGIWDAAYAYLPVGVASGDYVDVVPLDGGEFVFLVGDVSGKGVAASLLMTHLHATVRSLASLRWPLDDLLAHTNRMFYASVGAKQYATLLCGRASANGEITIANAGHCPPVILSGDRAITLPPTSVPIGLFAESPFPTSQVHLQPGDTLVVYTDGITDAADAAGTEYASERLVSAASRYRELAPRDLVDACMADLARFTAGGDRRDDVTLFALRRR